MYVISIVYLISILLIGIIVLGEFIASTNTNGKFHKWWRKNVIGDGGDMD